jgi:hypothetical protein
MAAQGSAVRINWLLADPELREAYRVHRGLIDVDELPKPGGHPLTVDGLCLRCGAPVTPAGSGYRAPCTVLVRDRGSDCKNVTAHRIHNGCIPRAGESPQRGIPARGRNASQVRTKVE